MRRSPTAPARIPRATAPGTAVDVTTDVEERERLLVHAILAGETRPSGAPDTWMLLAGRLDDLDGLSDLERMALPLLVGRWKADGRDLDPHPRVRGIRRQMVVRNRLILAGAQVALDRLREADIPVLPIKSAGLVGRILPPAGLRPIADVDLWVRPRDHAAAVRLLAPDRSLRSGRRATRDPHGRMLRDTLGRELDLHRHPSELFAGRTTTRTGRTDADARFDRTWARATDGHAALADLIHLSFLNPLHSHAPGEARAVFALIELDAILRHPDVTDTTLHEVASLTVEDGTTVVLVEHLDRLGPGVSDPLDRFLHDHLEPALGDDDRPLRDWLARTRPTPGTDPTFHRRLRKLAHTHRTVPDRPVTIIRWLARAEAHGVRRRPWASLRALASTRPWRRVGRIARGMATTRPTSSDGARRA
ncbi:MAG: putative nucleotidyltransferase [Actinomycetota bacterium]|jgi:hypothetical protein